MAAVQRLRQGIRALLAFSREVDYALAERYLSPAQMTLFHQLSRSEQLHSVNVLNDILTRDAHIPADLAVAALLHDAGKGRYQLAVWQKTVAVLIKKFAPRLENRLSAEDRLTFWRAPFVVRRYHPRWGADLLTTAGASQRAIWLVAHHADPLTNWADHPNVTLLATLKWADDRN